MDKQIYVIYLLLQKNYQLGNPFEKIKDISLFFRVSNEDLPERNVV